MLGFSLLHFLEIGASKNNKRRTLLISGEFTGNLETHCYWKTLVKLILYNMELLTQLSNLILGLYTQHHAQMYIFFVAIMKCML